MFKTRIGNLITLAEQGEFDYVVHGCNCQHTMNSGIAKEIKARYPGAYLADLDTPKSTDKLGTYSQYETGTFTIINGYTQPNYGYDPSVCYFDYAAFSKLLQGLSNLPKGRFGFPLIGCGLGRADESRVVKMLEDFSTKQDTTLVLFKWKLLVY